MYLIAKQKIKKVKVGLNSVWGKLSSNVSKKFFIVAILIGVNLAFATNYYLLSQKQSSRELVQGIAFFPKILPIPPILKTPFPQSELQPTSISTPTSTPTTAPTVISTSTPISTPTLVPVTPIVSKPFIGCASPYTSVSPWNTRIKSPQYHPQSSKFISSLSGVFGADSNQYTYPVYEVNKSTPLVKVTYSGVFSEVLTNGKILNRDSGGGVINMPMPVNIAASSGDDSQLIVINTETGAEWGLYEAHPNGDGTWRATNAYKYNINWDGLTPSGFGSRGAGVTYLAGLIRKCEIEKGSINHAIAFGYDYPSSLFVYPATKSDGRGSVDNDLPEGARLQLNPNATESEINGWCTGTGINTTSCKIVVKALQEYGMIVVDGSGHPKIYAEDNKTANWGNLWSSKIPSKIPLSAFKVINW